MLAQYVEVEEVGKVIEVKAVKQRSPYFVEIIRMLENWGIWARYYFDGAYPHETLLYKLSKQGNSYDIIDEEIIIIDEIMKGYKNSKYEKEKDWHRIVELKYKGINHVENGSQCYKCLNEFAIADDLECSRKTVNNKFHKLIEDIEEKLYKNY